MAETKIISVKGSLARTVTDKIGRLKKKLPSHDFKATIQANIQHHYECELLEES